MNRSTVIISLLAVLVAMGLNGCATGPQGPAYGVAAPVSVVGPQNMQIPHTVRHVVGPSENLWRISKTYGVDINTLMAANNLSNPTMIKNGQTLIIPGTTGARQLIPLYPSHRWTYIIVHHTATDVGDAFAIDSLHHKRGWDQGLGYHFIINNGTKGKEDGQIQVGPRWVKQMVGAHTKASNMNDHGIGIGLVGNFSENLMTENEMEALVFLTKTLMEFYQIPSSRVLRHKDVPGAATECPGNLFPWAEFKRRINS